MLNQMFSTCMHKTGQSAEFTEVIVGQSIKQYCSAFKNIMQPFLAGEDCKAKPFIFYSIYSFAGMTVHVR